MKKSKFIKSTIILIIGGFVTKILGMIIKIVMTRFLGKEGIGLYMLLSPTFMLLIALAQLGLPVAISKLVAEKTKNNKKLVFSVIPISLLINGLIMIFLIISSGFISSTLLKEPRIHYSLLAIGFVLPFISISSILRGYFFGKEMMIPHVISNIAEDIVRLIILAIGIPLFLIKGLEYAVLFVVISNIISELTSIFILLFFLPKKISISKNDFKIEKKELKEILGISIPTTGSRLIGSIGYFFEPIIITSVLLSLGFSNYYVVSEYGIINGYIMPLLLLPSFFTLAISQALIPVISNAYVNKKISYCKSKLRQGLLFSLLIGVPVTLVFIFLPELPLKLIYNTTEGLNYLKILAPIFLLYYIQVPLTSTLQAMGKAKEAMNGTLIGMILRTVILIIGCYLKLGMYALIIASSINIIVVTIHQFKHVKKCLN